MYIGGRNIYLTLTLSCPGTGRAVVKIGHSNLRSGSKEWLEAYQVLACDACLQGAGGVCLYAYFHCKFPKWMVSEEWHISIRT